MKYFICIILLSFSLSVFATETKMPSMHSIEIEGNKDMDTSMLQDILGVDRQSMFVFWKDEAPQINDKLIPTLLETLKHFYESQGYYDAHFSMDENNATVSVYIQENTPVRVSDIDIVSDLNISSDINLHVAEIFKAKAFIESKEAIINQLLSMGYCSYDLDTKAYVDLDKHTASLHYRLKKGGICTFGEPVIKGLKSIDEKVIRSRVRAKKGERFDPKKVKETYAAIYSLNAFDALQISVDRKFYNEVPVDIVLNEVENAYHFEGGVGYDTYIGPRIHASLVKKNFYGDAQKTGIKLSWSKKEQLAVADYYKPVLFLWGEYGIDFGANLGYSNLEFPGFQEKKGFTKLYVEHNEGKIKLRMGVALENIDIHAQKNLKKNQSLQQAVSEGTFLLLYPYMNVVYDARDDKLNAKYGYYFSGYIEYGIDYKPNATSYIKSLLEARGIYTFDGLTLSSVGKVGVVDEKTQTLPESKLLFAGGVYANRAYGFNSIGVIRSPRIDTIFGASTWLNLSFEANYPIVGKLYGAVFNDNTMLNDASYDFSGQIISSAGVGIRYVTPIGPFKVDVGWNVNKLSEYGSSFQIGQSF